MNLLAAFVVQSGSPEEARSYAAREAAAPHLADFRGGDLASAALLIILIAGIAYLVYYFMEQQKGAR